MAIKAEILVVDDEPQIRKLLHVGLTSYGYAVVAVTNGQEALAAAAAQKPDIILLDINLNSTPDGLDVCRQLRAWSATPIIMLTVNDSKQTRLAALNADADDYITKPFDMEELEARIRTVLRRSAIEKSSTPSGEIRIYDLVLDLVKHRVVFKGSEIHLTPTEYKLLSILATHPGKVLTIKTLAQEIRGESDNPKTDHFVRVYINTLRKKLQEDPANSTQSHYIFSEPGVGYRFTDLEPIH